MLGILVHFALVSKETKMIQNNRLENRKQEEKTSYSVQSEDNTGHDFKSFSNVICYMFGPTVLNKEPEDKTFFVLFMHM